MDTTKTFTLLAADNGTTKVRVLTNWSSGAYGYVILLKMTNSTGGIATNVSVKVGAKPGH